MKDMNTPIYRAKKIDSDEYVEGYCAYDESTNNYCIITGICLGNIYGWVNPYEIDPTTLAIHFPNTINTNSEKVWYNMEEILNIVKEYENGKVETN